MWIPSHSAQAMNPLWRPNGPSQPMLVTPASRPITATSPLSRYSNGSCRPAENAPPDDLGRIRARLDRALGDTGHGPALLPRLHRRIADDEDLGMPGDRSGPARRSRVRLDRSRRRAPWPRPGQSSRPARRPPTAPSGPGSSCSVPSDIVDPNRPVVDVDDPGPRAHLHAESLELLLGGPRSIGRIGRQDPVHRLDEDDPRLTRPDRPEVAAAACRARSRRGRPPAPRPSARRRPRRTSSIRAFVPASASRSAASKAIRIRRRISVASSIVLRPGASDAQSG